MVYLTIKEMAKIANDVIIVTSRLRTAGSIDPHHDFKPFSLTKDMTGKEDAHRGPAIRALCSITDVCSSSIFLQLISFSGSQSAMLQGIERYLKQAIVDKNPSVSSAALVSSIVSYAVTVIRVMLKNAFVAAPFEGQLRGGQALGQRSATGSDIQVPHDTGWRLFSNHFTE